MQLLTILTFLMVVTIGVKAEYSNFQKADALLFVAKAIKLTWLPHDFYIPGQKYYFLANFEQKDTKMNDVANSILTIHNDQFSDTPITMQSVVSNIIFGNNSKSKDFNFPRVGIERKEKAKLKRLFEKIARKVDEMDLSEILLENFQNESDNFTKLRINLLYVSFYHNLMNFMEKFEIDTELKIFAVSGTRTYLFNNEDGDIKKMPIWLKRAKADLTKAIGEVCHQKDLLDKTVYEWVACGFERGIGKKTTANALRQCKFDLKLDF